MKYYILIFMTVLGFVAWHSCTEVDGMDDDIAIERSTFDFDENGFLVRRHFDEFAKTHQYLKNQSVNRVIYAYVLDRNTVEFIFNGDDPDDDELIVPQLGWFVYLLNQNYQVDKNRIIHSSGMQFIEVHVTLPF